MKMKIYKKKNFNFRIAEVEEELRKTRGELEKKKKEEEVRFNIEKKSKHMLLTQSCKLNTF